MKKSKYCDRKKEKRIINTVTRVEKIKKKQKGRKVKERDSWENEMGFKPLFVFLRNENGDRERGTQISQKVRAGGGKEKRRGV